MPKYDVEKILKVITHNDLHLYKPVNSKFGLKKVMNFKHNNNNKKGIVFISKNKEDLSSGRGLIISSYESLLEMNVTHWTPNTFRGGTYYDFSKRIIKGHTKNNLKQINILGFDVDTKNIDIYNLYIHCQKNNFFTPNLIIETPNGYQFFYILKTPFYIHKNNNYKTIRIAEKIYENIKDLLNTVIPIDKNCNPFGFFRIPKNNNIIYFNEKLVDTNDLIAWSIDYTREKVKKSFNVIYGGINSSTLYTKSAWYKALLSAKHIKSGHYASSRNNTLFTLALANYADNVSYEDAYNELDIWNSNLKTPLNIKEFERTINSAYSGRYSGVKREYVQSLIENWTDGSVSFTSKVNGWYKFAKPRTKRVRSHLNEWIADIKTYLKNNTNENKPFLESTFRKLANKINVPLTSLKRALKNGDFVVRTKGKGRSAKSYFADKGTFILHLIKLKKDNKYKDRLHEILKTFNKVSTQTQNNLKTTETEDFKLCFKINTS